MIIELELNTEKAEQYNQRIRELRVQHPEFQWKEVNKLEDAFCPYPEIMRDKAWNNYKHIAKDNRPDVEMHGIYVCGLSANHTLEEVTNYKEAKKYIDFLSHSTCHRRWVRERLPKLEQLKGKTPV